MTRTLRALVLALTATLAAPAVARAEFKSWKDQVPPDIAGATQVQGEKVSGLKPLRGHLVALVFFATW